MAIIGQQLTAPEQGWKRYDDTDSIFSYKGTWNKTVGTGYYNTYAKFTTDNNSTVSFKFYGDKIRLIGNLNSDQSNNVSITIDGIKYNFNTNGNTQRMTLVFEKLDLTKSNHEVLIVNEASGNYTFDAVDINSDGRILHPDEVLSVQDLEIGKRIRFNYSALSNSFGGFYYLGKETSNFLPTTPIANPNGDAYFIMVDVDRKGRKILVADRNIQNAISWDTLNRSGLASGSGLPIMLDVSHDIMPLMISNNSPEPFVITTNVSYFTNNEPFKVFDNNLNTWWAVPASEPFPNLLKVDLGNKKAIARVSITAFGDSGGGGLKDFEILGSNTDSSDLSAFEILYSGTHPNSDVETLYNIMVPNNIRYFVLKVKSTYRSYTNPASANTVIREIKIMENLSPYVNFTMRLLTGGVASNDTDNEWNKYIVNSSLSSDNVSFWNTSGTSSLTSSSNSTGGSYRSARGNASISTFSTILTSSVVAASTGFRPVVVIEESSTIKYLIRDIEGTKAYNGSLWSIVGGFDPTVEDFMNYGMDSLLGVDFSLLNSRFEVICWTDNIKDSYKLELDGLPKIEYKYKVELLEPYSVLKDWSSLLNSNIEDIVTIPSSIFTSAINPYTIKVTSEQSDNIVVTEQTNVTLYDTEPTLIATINGLTLNIDVGDNENNKVQFKYSLNGNQFYPEIGFTQLSESPIQHTFTFSSNDVLIGRQNVISIVARDEYGKESSVNLNFIGQYSGIMFCDENNEYFSTDLGEILKYLDLGVIVAGQVTNPVLIKVKNTSNSSVSNLILSKVVSPLQFGIELELSKTKNPFVAEDTLNFNETLKKDEEIEFFIRVSSNKDALPFEAVFDLQINGEKS